MPLPASIYDGLQSIGSKSSQIIATLEERVPDALESSTKESRMVAYRKMMETTLGTKLPRSVLRIRTPENPYGKMA